MQEHTGPTEDNRRHFADMFHILELLALRPQMERAELCQATSIEEDLLDQRLDELRRLGIDIGYEEPQGGYRILSWGRILRPEAFRSGVWREFVTAPANPGAED